MKRFSFFATATVALTLGLAACSDTATEPVQPTLSVQQAELTALESKYGGRSSGSLLAACLAATGNNTLLCTQPLATVCAALTASQPTTFTFTINIFGRQVVYTVTVRPNAAPMTGAVIELARAGVPIASRPIDAATIARLCSGGGIGGGDDDYDR